MSIHVSLFCEYALSKVYIHNKDYVANHINMCSCGLINGWSLFKIVGINEVYDS